MTPYGAALSVYEQTMFFGQYRRHCPRYFIWAIIPLDTGYLTHEETSDIQGHPWIKREAILDIADRKLDPAPPTTTKSNRFIACCM